MLLGSLPQGGGAPPKKYHLVPTPLPIFGRILESQLATAQRHHSVTPTGGRIICIQVMPLPGHASWHWNHAPADPRTCWYVAFIVDPWVMGSGFWWI